MGRLDLRWGEDGERIVLGFRFTRRLGCGSLGYAVCEGGEGIGIEEHALNEGLTIRVWWLQLLYNGPTVIPNL
jgi:hypothetical protein